MGTLVSGASSTAQPTGNLFLDHLPANALEALRSSFVPVSAKNGAIIYDREELMDKVLFPTGSVLSVVLEMADGDTAEVGIIGREGMSGVAILLGPSRSNQRTVVQIPNGALCLSADKFRAALEEHPDFKTAALRYAQAVLLSTSQLSACNNLHTTNERCARWLLMAHDRVPGDVLLLTQEFLSQMLGVRRGGVTLAASALQEAGFISYSRGHIKIRNRSGLESASCECYDSMERDWKALMGYSASKSSPMYRPDLTEALRRDGGGAADLTV